MNNFEEKTNKEIELLMQCGFNLYESKILLALAGFGQAEAKEIAQAASVPKNKVYEILENLLEKEVVQVLPTKPKKYAILDLKQFILDNIEAKKEFLSKTKGEVMGLLGKIGSPKLQEKDFWVMEGKAAMVNKIVKVLVDIQKESIGFIDIWTAKPENLKAIRRAAERGVKFYFLGPINKNTLPMVKKYRRLGVKVKNYYVKGAGYSIFDSKYVQMRITDKKVISLWIENCYLAGILRQHFFEAWKKVK